MAEQLQHSPRKEVFLYVHGYHNTFEDAGSYFGNRNVTVACSVQSAPVLGFTTL